MQVCLAKQSKKKDHSLNCQCNAFDACRLGKPRECNCPLIVSLSLLEDVENNNLIMITMHTVLTMNKNGKKRKPSSIYRVIR